MESDAADIIYRHSQLGFTGDLGSLYYSRCKLHCGPVGDQRRNIGKSGFPELRVGSFAEYRL